MTTITERVARGAGFLDEHDPNWWRPDVPNAIDLDELDLSQGECCVLGQRCPLEAPDTSPYSDQLRRITNGAGARADVLEVWAAEMGFTVSPYVGSAHWHKLTAAWRELIEARRQVTT